MDEDVIACFESSSGRYFPVANENELKQIIDDLNDLADKNGQVSMNEVYKRVGLENTDVGDRFGWTSDSVSEKRKIFSVAPSKNLDGQEYMALIFSAPPKLIKVV